MKDTGASNNGPATLPGEEAKGKKLRKNGKGKKEPPNEEETSILKGNKGNGKGKNESHQEEQERCF